MTVVKQIAGIDAPGDDDHNLVVTCTFSAQEVSGGLGDWGEPFYARSFVTQNGSTTYGENTTIDSSGVRRPYTVSDEFSVVAGFTITAGLDCSLGSPGSIDFYDVKVQVIDVKR